jgi:hypothetical protein
MGSLKLLGISISDFDNSLEIEYSRLRKHFKLVRVDVDKSRWDDFFISAYILDPLNRGWVVCPGETLDYWCPSGANDDWLIEYADLNKKESIEKQKLFIKSLEVLNHDFFNIANYDEFADYDKLLDNMKSHARSHYYLNIYQTVQTIPYKYLSKSIQTDNPIDDKECETKACMHPQFGYHIDVNELPVELSIEFTIPANQIGSKLKLIGVYVIDVSILNENINKTFDKFKALEAIILKADFTK